MQTDDMLLWGKKSGWSENLLYPYFADLGLSGTLRPDQRPDMLRVFDDLDSGKFDGGTFACWQENRPFRDETHIYYNQLIEKLLQHDVVFVVLSPRLYIYDMRDPFDKERLREKFKEAADFIPKHVKGWLHPARERAAWEDDEWAGMGDLPPGFICDYDPQSPTYKHAIPYWPHIEKVKEHFELYRELGGEISLFYQHLRLYPIVFPDFPSGTDRKVISKFKLSKFPGGGFYIKGKGTLVSMLTHPMYRGYRAVKGVIRRDGEGNKLQSFEPVIDLELLDFAYYRHAQTDFDGNILERKSKKRYFRDKDAEIGLLKFRIYSDQGEVRVHRESGGVYRIQGLTNGYLQEQVYSAEISCSDVDTCVVNRLLEHAETLAQRQEDIEAYEASAAQVRNARLAKIHQIEQSILDISRDQSGLTRNIGRVELEIEDAKAKGDTVTTEIKEKRLQLLEQEIETLEKERRILLKAKETLEEEVEDDIGSLDEELIKLKNGWDKYNFKKRRSLLNFAVQEVRINKMSTHWISIQVTWLNEEWGTERMYYKRRYGALKEWSEEEKAIIKQHYATMPINELMTLLPERSIWSMRSHVYLHLDLGRRSKQEYGSLNLSDSYADMQFKNEQNIPAKVSYTNWEALYSLKK
ncbi:MAG: hypothetical protein H0V70_15055 [Ktedonobacteraceae bacterium]|nr:hypothetical protein [Ktedonobacteraceae bacterium]